MDKTAIIERVRLFANKYHVTNKELGEMINVSGNAVSYYFSGKAKLPLDIILSILKTYPQISTDWLLFGEGEMEVDRISIERLNAIIEEKNAKIEALQHQVRQLEKRIDTILNNLK